MDAVRINTYKLTVSNTIEFEDNSPMKSLFIIVLSSFLALQPVQAQENNSPVIEAMEAYLDFVEFGGGIVLPKQIAGGEWKAFHIIDTRLAEDCAAGHLDGAKHIEWRNVLARRNEIPRDKLVLLYCNTGAQSAQAYFALRVAGWDNARLLQGGLDAWKREADSSTIVK
jgi:rhodanese-related sulfurtransferase